MTLFLTCKEMLGSMLRNLTVMSFPFAVLFFMFFLSLISTRGGEAVEEKFGNKWEFIS